MSWRCSGATNSELVANLQKHNLLKTPRIKDTFLKVDRAHFSRDNPYDDAPQRIGYDATISAPHMHANAVEELRDFLKPGAKVLDVGSGSGYLTAIFGHLVSPGGKVVGVEHIPQLRDLSVQNLNKNSTHAKMLEDGTIQMVVGDGRKGYKDEAPYDAIHVGAAAATLHQDLVDQLKAPGRMFIPLENGFNQYIYRIDKKEDGTIEEKDLYGVMFVPLTDAKKYE